VIASSADNRGRRHGNRWPARAAGRDADAAGYQPLLDFARAHVPGRRCFAVEGAGSYGAGLTRVLVERGEWVVEVDRPSRPARRGGKTDALDAIRAAREALLQQRPTVPRPPAPASRPAPTSRSRCSGQARILPAGPTSERLEVLECRLERRVGQAERLDAGASGRLVDRASVEGTRDDPPAQVRLEVACGGTH
jgi:hypothetical protein